MSSGHILPEYGPPVAELAHKTGFKTAFPPELLLIFRGKLPVFRRIRRAMRPRVTWVTQLMQVISILNLVKPRHACQQVGNAVRWG